jgi:hypothetical protein
MKSAKKLIYIDKKGFVPEAEILYTDPEKKEYKNVNFKIQKTLKNPKLSQLEKQIKYQSLNRKRKVLNKEIENKLLKVIINSNVQKEMPTTGIEPKKEKQNEPRVIKLEENQQIKEQFEAQRNKKEQQNKERVQEQEEPKQIEKQKLTFADFKGIIPENKYDQIADYVYENRARFGILETGQIYKNKNESRFVEPGSRYRDVLGYLTGQKDINNDQKNVAGILIRRLLKDEEFKNFIQQQGQGVRIKPRYIIDTRTRNNHLNKSLKNIKKTQGLIRKFRPTLWTKVPI